MCRLTDTRPDCAVVVGTVRALKMHGGVAKSDLDAENCEAVRAGLPNVLTHVANMRDVFGLPAVVALNIFPTDTDAEIECVMAECAKVGAECIRSTVWADGSAGALELARAVKDLCEQPHEMRFAYDSAESLEDKIVAVVRKVYGGCDVDADGTISGLF